MPDLNGYEVAAQIRREPWGREIMLIALTGWGQREDRARAHAAGFDQHCTKPVDAARLQRLFERRPA
jgi:CheY-like chemotaxis protein